MPAKRAKRRIVAGRSSVNKFPDELLLSIFRECLATTFSWLSKPQPLPSAHLRPLVWVNRQWSRVALELYSYLDTRIATFKLGQNTTADDIALIMRDLRHPLRDLHLSIQSFLSGGGVPTMIYYPFYAIHWYTAFDRIPHLTRLQLTGCADERNRIYLNAILDAASKHCPNISALSLPVNRLTLQGLATAYYSDKAESSFHTLDTRQNPPRYITIRHLGWTQPMLSIALHRWFANGATGGIRYLSIPSAPVHSKNEAVSHLEDGRLFFKDAFFDALAQYCPNLEYLDGITRRLSSMGKIDPPDAQAVLTPQSWDRFTTTCTNLKAFNWQILDHFRPEHMLAFARKPKLNLTHMVLATTLNPSTNSVFSSESLGKMVEACPNLEVLEVGLTEDISDGIDSFDDEFFETLTKSCPNLHTLTFTRYYNDVPHLFALTTSGLTSLSHSSIRTLSLPTPCASGTDLLTLLNNLPPLHWRKVFFNPHTGIHPTNIKDLLNAISLQSTSKYVNTTFLMSLPVYSNEERLHPYVIVKFKRDIMFRHGGRVRVAVKLYKKACCWGDVEAIVVYSNDWFANQRAEDISGVEEGLEWMVRPFQYPCKCEVQTKREKEKNMRIVADLPAGWWHGDMVELRRKEVVRSLGGRFM